MNTHPSALPLGANDDGHPDLDRVLGALSTDEADGLRAAWDAAALAAPDEAPDPAAVARIERVLADLVAPSINGRHRDRPAVRTPRRSRRRLLAWMASLVIVAMLALGWIGRPVTYEAAPGERLDLRLPDGSTVTLNSGSTLRQAGLFGSPFTARSVRLEGEAFFEVTEDAVPFIVHTFDARVTVLGTTFGVRAWADEPEATTTVALVSGRVRLTPEAHPEAATVLAAGDVRSVAPEAASEASATEALAWRHGDLVYKDRPLAVILRDVERRFGVVLTARPPDLGSRRVSVALRTPASAEAVVRDLAAAFGLRYRPRADGYELYSPSLSLPSPH